MGTDSINCAPPFGYQARFLRVVRLLTQQDLAEMAGVSAEEVDLLESGQPLASAAVHKVLNQLGLPVPN